MSTIVRIGVDCYSGLNVWKEVIHGKFVFN